MKSLQCDPNTLAGPIDERVVRNLKGLDPAFVAHMAEHHGGRPKSATFQAGPERRRFDLFLSLLDRESKPPPPYRPHFNHSELDERLVDSIWFLTSVDHSTSRALFGGLTPFAALEAGMCLDRAYVDLLCFDIRNPGEQPPIVLWNADRANEAYMDWDDLPSEEAFDEDDNITGVPWDDFLIPVAPNYTAFVEGLQPNAEE